MTALRLLFDARYTRTDFHDGISRYSAELAAAVVAAAPERGVAISAYPTRRPPTRASPPDPSRTCAARSPSVSSARPTPPTSCSRRRSRSACSTAP